MAITRITKGVIKPNENYDTHNINSTGIVTAIGLDINGNADVSGSLSVGGVLTYEDVTSIDSVGIITARTGLVSPYADIDDFVSVGNNIHLGNAGVITATSFVGDGSGLIGVASTDNIITGTAATFNTYPVDINAGMDVAGVTTAVTVDINGDIDVDGHTNLDNVSVSGISTFSGILDATNTPASIRVAQEIQHKGDADTALSFGTDIISLKTAGTERLRIQADGDVSFGDETTGRAQIKHLSGDQANRNNGGFPQYAFVGNEGTGMRRVSSNVLAFDTTGDERIRITSAGNIGIGISSPNKKLHLSGASGSENTLRIDTNGTAIAINNHSETIAYIGNDAGKLSINAGGTEDTLLLKTNSNTRLTINSDGNATFSGIVTAASFSGDGSNLTGIVGGKFNGPAAGILTTSSVGIQTNDITSANLVGAATSLVGLYIGDGSLLFSNNLSRAGGYYITTGVNALNAGPVTLNTKMTLAGTWVVV